MDQKHLDILTQINVNLINILKVLKTISADNEISKIALKRISKQDNSPNVYTGESSSSGGQFSESSIARSLK